MRGFLRIYRGVKAGKFWGSHAISMVEISDGDIAVSMKIITFVG